VARDGRFEGEPGWGRYVERDAPQPLPAT
jgi:hypothetical protein